MTQSNDLRFTAEVAERLKYYVYRLIDPRNGETFYVGKGQGDRVFAHSRGEIDRGEDELNTKLRRIRDIRIAGLDIGYIVHRHGMDEDTALEVEAALIDAYSRLENEVAGAGSNDFGPAHPKQIIQRYTAEVANFDGVRALIISINRSATEVASFYEATRFAWVVRKEKAESAEYVLPCVQGMIVDAFVADHWMAATPKNFPGRPDRPGRFGFEGKPAPEKARKRFVGKRIPDDYRKRGAANPIKYTW